MSLQLPTWSEMTLKTIMVGGAAFVLALTGCSGTSGNTAPSSETESAAPFPAEVQSCEETLTFEEAPERILLLSETDFAILYELGLSDKIVAKSGNRRIDEQYPELNDTLDAIPDLEGGSNGTGGVKLSTESVLEVEPDVVFGYDSGVDREQLANAGVKLYSPDAWCDDYTNDGATFELVTNEIDKVATMFGVPDQAESVKATVTEEIAEVEANSADGRGSAAALFVMPGSQEFYSYGYSSMIQPIFETNGLENVYSDVPDRVFEAAMKSLLDEDPEWIILMEDSPNASYEETKEILMTYPGVEGLQAVKNDQLIYLPFVLTDPPTTLSVDGAIRLGELLDEQG